MRERVPSHFNRSLTWNSLSAFLHVGVNLKSYDVYGAAFCNISLDFNKTVSTVRLMKEGSDVNITDFGTASYYLYITTTLNAYHHSIQLITILKSV